MAKLTGKETFRGVLSEHPELAEVFFEHGMACAMCGMAGVESIEQGAKSHGIDPKKLVMALNKKLQKKK